MDRDRRATVGERIAPFVAALTRNDAPVEELALLVSSALDPRVDVIGALADLDELAGECPTPTRDGVMQFLFASGGEPRLRGDTVDYHHWRNSALNHVVTSGTGMPITLAVAAIAVARRVGVELVGVGMPGHFLIGDPRDPNWFTDPFTGAIGIDRDACRALATSVGTTRWHDAMLAPTPPRLIVARILNNLRATCTQRNDTVRLAIVMQLRQVLPEFAAEADAARRALAVFN